MKFLAKYTATVADAQAHLANQGERHILMAHGAHAPIETELIFEVPGAKMTNIPIAAAYPLSKVLSVDFKPVENKLGIACCYPGKMPVKVREVELIKLVHSSSANIIQMAGPSIDMIVDVWMCLMGFTKEPLP